MNNLTVAIISESDSSLLRRAIKSAETLTDVVVIDIDPSGTRPLGERKRALVREAKTEWVLLIDTDEMVSPGLAKQIKEKLATSPPNIHGYKIPYRNHVLGRPVTYGGERYSKTRLFRRKYATVTPASIHEEVVVKGKIGRLTGYIYHYSYRGVVQIFKKFTKYAWQVSEMKYKASEDVSLRKLILYGPHMFWARFYDDKGWKDGWRGFFLAACFGYMENMIYIFLLLKKLLYSGPKYEKS